MVGTTLRETLIEANFGEIEYRVVFQTLECNRVNFSAVNANDVADLTAIERYGCALRVAKEIMQCDSWVLTKERFLVCVETGKPVPTLLLNINIDENVEVLAKYDFETIRLGVAIPIERIDGLDVNIGKRPWLWCVFK